MLRQSKMMWAALACAVMLGGAAAQAQEVSKALAKTLKAAQDSFLAKNYDAALASLREAQANPAKTAFDQYAINEFLGPIYANQKKYPEAFEAFSANVESPYVKPEDRGVRYKVLMQLAYANKNWPGVVDYGNRAVRAGAGGADAEQFIAQAYYQQGKYREAISGMQDLVTRAEKAGQRPSEDSLLLLADSYNRLGDDAARARIMEKLLSYYQKPNYWANALASSQQTIRDVKLRLNLYRLMAEVGTLRTADQYSEMAQLAVEQGFPGEAVQVLEQGLGKNVFTDQREKDRAGRLLESSRRQVAAEKAGLAQVEKEAQGAATGDLLVAVGASYLLNVGDASKGLALINQGVSKGSLKSPNDAYMLLGVAQARAKNGAEAQKAFGKVDGDANYERLAKLWSLRTRG